MSQSYAMPERIQEFFNVANGWKVFNALTYPSSQKVRFTDIKKRAKLANPQVSRVLDFLMDKGLILKDGKYYLLNISEENQEKIDSQKIIFDSTRKKLQSERNQNSKFVSRLTDMLLLQNYPSSLQIDRPGLRIYGLREDVFYKIENLYLVRNKHSNKLDLGLSKEDVFGKHNQIGVDEALKNIVDFLVNAKRELCEEVVCEKINSLLKLKKYAKTKKFVEKWPFFWAKLFSYTNMNRDFFEKNILKGNFYGGFKNLDYEKEEDVELVKSLIPEKEKSLSKKELEKKYQHVISLQKQFVPYELFELIGQANDVERRILGDFVEEMCDYLLKEEHYPTAVSLVAHSNKNVYVV